MPVMRLAPMNVVQHDHLAALKIQKAEGIADSIREFAARCEGGDANFLQITPTPDYVACLKDDRRQVALWHTKP